MILKSLSRRANGAAQLIKYVLRDNETKQKVARSDLSQIGDEWRNGKLKLSFYRDYVTTRSKVIEQALSNARRLAKKHDLVKAIGERERFNPARTKGIKFYVNHNHIILRRSGLDTLYSIESPRLNALRKQEKREAKEESIQVILKHNISATDSYGYIKAFERNEANRIHKRTNAVGLHHSVLSFSPGDRGKINVEMMQDLSKKFIELHGKESLYLAVLHEDKNHKHIHILQSGTKISGLSNRVSKGQYQNIKVKLQEYQQEKYPDLVNSLANFSEIRTKDRAQNIKRNERTISDKLMLQELLETSYKNSRSIKDFVARIEEAGIKTYTRGDRLQGVLFNDIKFRFSRLGFPQERILTLNFIQEKEIAQLRELKDIRQPQGRSIRAIDYEKGQDEEKSKEVFEQEVDKEQEHNEEIEGSVDILEDELDEDICEDEKEDDKEDDREIDDDLSDMDITD